MAEIRQHGQKVELVSDGDDPQIAFGKGIVSPPDPSTDLIFYSGGVERARIVTDGTGTGLFSGSLTAFSVKAYGAKGDGTTDDTAAFQATYAAAIAAGGGIVYAPPGSYKIATFVAVAPNLAHRVLFQGAGIDTTTIVLGASASGFVVMTGASGITAVYKNVAMADLTVDASAVVANNRKMVGIFGTKAPIVGYTTDTNASISDIDIRRVKGIGGPVNTDGTNVFVWISVTNVVGTADTQQSVKRVYLADVDLAGGENGIQVGAFRGAGGSTDMANCFVDAIIVERWRHIISASAPSAFFVSNHLICPLRGFAGKVRVRDGYGYGCGDAGLEIDTAQDPLVERCTIEDSWNHNFFHVNYNTAQIPTAARVRYFKCTAKRTGLTVTTGFGGNTGQSFGWSFSDNPNFGHPLPVVMRDCAFVRTTADLGVQGEAIFTVAPQRLDVIDFLYDASSVNYNNASNPFPCAIWFRPAAGNTGYLRIKRARFQLAGAKAGGVASLWNAVKAFYGSVSVHMEDVAIDYNVSGVAATECRAIYFGDTNLATILTAIARNVRFERCTDTSADLFEIGPTSTTTLQPRILIDDCNLRALSEANISTEPKTLIRFDAGSGAQQNYANVFVRGSTPGGKKYPPALDGLTPGASPYTYQNQEGHTERIFVQGGTVSKIEWSQDNSTFYDLGVIAGSFIVEGGDYLKVTYTVAPTMTRDYLKAV